MTTGRACAVCGTPCRPPFRAPAAEMAPDLDGRPGEPARSTLSRWVATCRGCGAAAPDLAALPDGAAETVRSPEYQALGSKFLRWAAVCEGAGRRQEAAEAVLQAAWQADDAGQDASALRRRAALLWEGDPLRRLDVLRRAGDLEQAEAVAAALTGLDEDAARIVAFQRALIGAGDTSRQSIASALRPPARTPHAAHGKPAGPGLLSRLLGR